MLDWTLNVQCNGASQWLCYSRHDLKPVNQLRRWQNEPRSFQNGEHMSEKEEFFWRCSEVWEMFCKRLQHDTKNTEQSCWLITRAPVTTLVVSKEADEPLSAVAGNQTNIDCWIMTVRLASRSWCLHQLMSPACCPVLIRLWLFFTRSLHPSITQSLDLSTW